MRVHVSGGCLCVEQKAMKDKIVYDIEDLVVAGKQRVGCPYFASKALFEEATLVRCLHPLTSFRCTLRDTAQPHDDACGDVVV